MPIYEYFCPDCDLKFELLRPLGQLDETTPCPNCNTNAERMLSRFTSFSKNAEGMSTPINGSSSCSTCSATSCASCKG